MFGYLKPDNPYLYLKDETLYKSLYCGICKSIGKVCGQIPRITLTFDMAFMSAISHNILGVDVKINKERCIAHHIKKRPVAKPDEISLKLGAVNVLLAYYKVKDDIVDENRGGLKSSLLKKGYKKAKKLYPNVDKIIFDGYNALRKYEIENSDSIDIVCDPFATILQDISSDVFGDKTTDFTKGLFYALGKWIYLIDALDDYDKDVKSNSFNVLYNLYKSPDFKTLISEHKNEIFFIFSGIFAQIAENFKNIEMKYNTDLVVNILTRGIPTTTNKIISKGLKND
ncbi:MAG: hypothetical protein IKJ14_04635 [Clostridia bacterium]|nr:hypothetical protein [Clostridia bacterium]